MESEHFIGKIAQKAVIEKDGKVLISHHPHDKALWELPGGRLHRHEDLKEGLRREIMEELGAEYQVEDMFYAEPFTSNITNESHILLTYRVTLSYPEKEFTLDPSEIREVKWITKDELHAQEIYPNCMRALKIYFGVV